MTVYAVWAGEVRSVTFNYKDENGANKILAKKYVVLPETRVTLVEIPVRENYVFQGWYTEEKDDIVITNKDSEDDVTFSGEIPDEDKFILGSTDINIASLDVYALWQERPEHSVMVTFQAYPGSSVQSIFVIQNNGWKMADNANLPLTGDRAHYDPVAANKWFIADKDDNPANDVEFTKDKVLSEEGGDITVAAKWDGKTYTVRFMTGVGDTAHSSTTVKYPLNTVGLPIDMPTRGAAYSNDGKWYKTQGGGEVQFTETSIVTGDINVHPKWVTANFNLTSLSAKYGAMDAAFNIPFEAGAYTYTSSLPSFAPSVTVTADYEGPEGTSIAYTPSSASVTNFTGSNNTVTVTLTCGDLPQKVYVVTFTKKTVAETQMANGGTTTFVQVNSGSNATWDEVHTFTTVGGGQLVFNAASPNISARILLVAGGGGGGGGINKDDNHRGAAGGGAGGVVHKTNYAITTKTSTVTVGAGGAKGTSAVHPSQPTNGTNGSDSIFTSTNTLKALGGGGGSCHGHSLGGGGLQGGSAGGAVYNSIPVAAQYWNGSSAVDSSESGPPTDTRQGNKGGAGYYSVNSGGSGGGGGAGGEGGSVTSAAYKGGNGGVGWQCDITGTNTYYAGGGAGECSIPSGTGGNTLAPNGTGDIGQGGRGAAGNWLQATAGKAGAVIVRFPYSE